MIYLFLKTSLPGRQNVATSSGRKAR